MSASPAVDTEQQSQAVATPWMTTDEAAVYLRQHEKTVLRALRKYQRTDGREGLKGGQPNGPNTKWFVHIADADRYMRGERPARPSRNARAA